MLVFAAGEYIALAWLAPRYVTQLVERLAGSTLAIEQTRLTFPLTTTFTGLRLVSNTPDAALTLQRVVVRPRWVSLPTRTVWLEAVEVDRPYLRLHRTADGTLRWPRLNDLMPTSSAAPAGWPQLGATSGRGWHVRIDSLKLTDAVVEFVDEKPSQPFRGSLDHLSLIMGPVTIPSGGSQMSVALRGEVVGMSGHLAPISCSGWTDVAARNLEAACQLDPIALKAFEPYYQGKAEVRVYDVMVKSTSQWVAKSNDLTGRLQLEFSNLREGDLSVHGRTIIDVKQLTKGDEQSSLRGDISLSGPLDAPSQWHSQLIPVDDQIQQLVGRLEEHGVKAIKLPFLGSHVRLDLMPVSEATAAEAEAAGEEMQEALEILAGPTPNPVTGGPLPITSLRLETAPLPAPLIEPPALPTPSVGAPPAASTPVSVTSAPATQPSMPPPVAPPVPPTPEQVAPPEPPPVPETTDQLPPSAPAAAGQLAPTAAPTSAPDAVLPPR